jgi:hypothetical protein
MKDVPLNWITSALFYLNFQLDQGHHLDVVRVRREVIDGSILAWLAHEAFGPETPLKLFAEGADIQTNASLIVLFQDLVANGWGRLKGPRKSGTALVASFFIEAIQRKYTRRKPAES